MADVFGPCPLCGCPREYFVGQDYDGEVRGVIRCVAYGCHKEEADLGQPFHPVEVIATREVVRKYRRTQPLLAPKCLARLHGLCHVRTCECWCGHPGGFS